MSQENPSTPSSKLQGMIFIWHGWYITRGTTMGEHGCTGRLSMRVQGTVGYVWCVGMRVQPSTSHTHTITQQLRLDFSCDTRGTHAHSSHDVYTTTLRQPHWVSCVATCRPSILQRFSRNSGLLHTTYGRDNCPLCQTCIIVKCIYVMAGRAASSVGMCLEGQC